MKAWKIALLLTALGWPIWFAASKIPLETYYGTLIDSTGVHVNAPIQAPSILAFALEFVGLGMALSGALTILGLMIRHKWYRFNLVKETD